MLFPLLLLAGVTHAILCPQLSSRHLSPGQAFQLPILASDNQQDVYMLLSMLKEPPWNMTTSYEGEAWIYFDQHHWTQADLLRAFGCL